MKFPAVAVNVAVLLCAGTVTDAGTVRAVEPELSVTVVFDETAALNVTVQVEVADGATELGLHERELTVKAVGGGVLETVMVPPVPEVASAEPAADAPAAPEIPIVADVAPETRVAFTIATTPLEILFPFMPERMHVYPAALFAQEIDLPAAVEAVPALTLIPEILAAGYVKVHSRAAGLLPSGDDNDKFSAGVLPADTVVEDSVSDCARIAPPHPNVNKRTKPKILDIRRLSYLLSGGILTYLSRNSSSTGTDLFRFQMVSGS